MQGWKVLLAMLGGALLFFLSAALLMPSDYHVAQALWIPAEPGEVFEELENLHGWEKWALWSSKMDATFKPSYSGPDRGVGAQVSWTSEEFGDGTRKITEADRPRRVTLDRTLAGGQGVATERITLQAHETEDGRGTRIIWGMAGDVGSSPIARLKVGLMQQAAAQEYDHNLLRLHEYFTKQKKKGSGSSASDGL